MINKIMYWKIMVFAGLALLLSLSNMILIRGNQSIQDQVNQRQSVINTAANVTALNQQLSQALYDMSLKDNDPRPKELLTSLGFILPKAAKEETKEQAEKKKGE